MRPSPGVRTVLEVSLEEWILNRAPTHGRALGTVGAGHLKRRQRGRSEVACGLLRGLYRGEPKVCIRAMEVYCLDSIKTKSTT